jgi:hypothetical protein
VAQFVEIRNRKENEMLSEKTLDKIVFEYQHGGVQSYHNEISMSERKALLKYLFTLPVHKNCDCVK